MSRFRSFGERTFSGRKKYILFVCTGNTCRSPMAYGVMRKLLEEAGVEDIEVRTAGVMTVPGLLPTQEVRQMLLKDGIDISNHRSCQLTGELIKRAYLVLGMTSFHVQMALRMAEGARPKTHLLKAFAGFDPKNDQVQDPMGCTLEVYKRVYREIRSACKRLLKVEAICPQNLPKPVEAVAPVKKTEKKSARKKAEAAVVSGNGAKSVKAQGKIAIAAKPKSAAVSAAKTPVPAAKTATPAAKSAIAAAKTAAPSAKATAATAKAAIPPAKRAAPAAKTAVVARITIKPDKVNKAAAVDLKKATAKNTKKTSVA